MNKIERVEKYLHDFFSNRFEDFDFFYKVTYRDRTYGIYKLEHGPKLMDLLHSIHGIIEDNFNFKKLVPHKFATPDMLFVALNGFKKKLLDNQKFITPNLKGEDTDYIISEISQIKDDLINAIEYSKQIYDYADAIIPYQELRYHLIKRDINKFIKTLKSIFSSVSYSITKDKEGYYHSNIFLILKLLGFEILAEEETNTGRIDAVIRFIDTIYILEFKFHNTTDLSQTALKQIKTFKYADKYYVEKKVIYLMGISFSKKEKNINGFKSEKLRSK